MVGHASRWLILPSSADKKLTRFLTFCLSIVFLALFHFVSIRFDSIRFAVLSLRRLVILSMNQNRYRYNTTGLPPFDVEWTNETENSNRENRHVLEGRLSTAQSRLHKDAIRTAYLALAEHDVRTGRDNHKSLSETMVATSGASAVVGIRDESSSGAATNPNHPKNQIVHGKVNPALFRAIDFCGTRLQTAQIGLLIIESAINAADYGTMNIYAERLGITMKSLRSINATSNYNSSSTDASNYQEAIIVDIDAKVQIAKGIERMVSGDYAEAAKILVPLVMRGSGGGGETSNNNANNNQQENSNNNNGKDHHMLNWPGVTAAEDVALYAGLMCLITRDRSKMLALADHPEALELVPSVKELLLYWSRANYAPCMRAFSECSGSSGTTTPATSLSTLSQPLLPMGVVVDIYLTPARWNALVQTIRETCLVEYLRPYQRVKLESLRDLFFPSPASASSISSTNDLDFVIDALADLMDRRLLPPTTRLDCREKILFRAEAPSDPGPNIRAMEERVLDDSHAMLVRLACLEHDLAITGDAAGGRRGKGGKGEGASRRHHGQQRHHGGRRGPGAMADSSESDEDDEDDVGIYKSYEDSVGAGGTAAAARTGDMGDTHMIDADEPSPPTNVAMNPEDMY